MDRAAKLAAEALDCLEFEKIGGYSPEAARASTRDMLAIVAEELGFAGGLATALAGATGLAPPFLTGTALDCALAAVTLVVIF